MATKGASYLYGNTRGTNGKGISSEHISYKYAIGFNRYALDDDFVRHGKDFGVNSAKQYGEHAIHFANTVDRKNNVSFVDKNGTTYKFNKKDGTLCLIKKNGIIISYYKPKGGYDYYLKQRRKYKI